MRHYLAAAAVACAAIASSDAQAVVGCTADEDCLSYAATPRCLKAPTGQGSPCTFDYAYNSTGWCSCQPQNCVPLTGSNSTSKSQWLAIGDSISLGYVPLVAQNASINGAFELVHAPSFGAAGSNNDNVWWHARCNLGWLGPKPDRWDVVTVNAGLHDLAFPDNEHLNVSTYASLLARALTQLVDTLPDSTAVVWMRTTPVPTNPPPQCVLLPGRLESSVVAYNAAADQVVASFKGRVRSCDLHGAITSVCGVGYSSCNITQCGGPHYSAAGFQILADTVAGCAVQALEDVRRTRQD